MSAILADLRHASRSLDGSLRRRKFTLLNQAARRITKLDDPGTLLELHDTLLFVAAFPDDGRMHALAQRSLRRLGRIVSQADRAQTRLRRRLTGSGVAGTHIQYAWSLDALRWLVQRFPRDVELIWRDESLGEVFEEMLATLAFPVEYDGLLDQRCSVRQWVTLAAARQHPVAWVVSQFDRLRAERCRDAQSADRLFEAMDLTVRWRLRQPLASRTLCRFPARPVFAQAPRGRPSRPPAAAQVIAQPLPRTRRLSLVESSRLIDIARAALAVRSRETDPVTHANPRDVVLHRLERGVDVLLLGMLPERRLPIEGFVGYVAARNRIPIAYGGGWVAFDACTVGINLFDAFRGGESSHIFAQILRVYRGMFDVRCFRVDPYQFGEDNEEAIRSGAFWFYHRMGFRPTEPELRELAQREAERIADDRAYRSRPATLRRLARGRLQLDLPDSRPRSDPPPDLGGASLAVTRWIARRFAGDRDRAAATAIRDVSAALHAGDRSRWPAAQRAAFESLCMLIALIPDLARWPAGDRAALLRIMRAKGGASEMAYLRVLGRHERLRAAISRIAQTTGDRAGK